MSLVLARGVRPAHCGGFKMAIKSRLNEFGGDCIEEPRNTGKAVQEGSGEGEPLTDLMNADEGFW